MDLHDNKNLCAICSENLIKGFMSTVSAYLSRTNVTVGEALQDIGWEVVDENLWSTTRCCTPCMRLLGKWNTARRTLLEINACWKERNGGRDLPMIPVVKKKRKEKIDGFKASLITLIKSSKYNRLMNVLKRKKSVREYMVHEVKKTIRQEMKCLEGDRTLFCPSDSGNDYSEPEWDDILDKIKIRAPTLFTVFFTTMSRSDQIARKKKKLLKNRMGMMFLIPLHHRKPRYHRIPRHLPLTFARTMFKTDTRSKTTSLSMRQVPPGFTKRRPIKKEVNSVVQSWRTSIEEETSTEHGILLAGADMHSGYSLVIDSGISESQYDGHPACNAFAVKNRVSFRELQEDTTVKASDLPLKTYLPSQKDYEELRMRMRVLVERILKANLDVFSHQSTLEHIPHQYSKECSLKSEYVNLELEDDDEESPNDPEGMLKILTKLSKLVPEDYDVPLHGDQETMTVIRSARKKASENPTLQNHINQLHPVPQDLRAAIVRDTIAELFTTTQATEKGTLRHLQEFFGHSSVNEEVSSFKHTDEFLLFIACAFVVGFAIEIMKKSKPSKSKPRLGPIADEIVRRIWYQLPMNRVADILNAPVEDHDDDFCFCKEDLEEADMVECCNIDCPNGRWFHQDCVMEVEAEGEWFCSPQCEQSNMGLFCICRQKGAEGTDLTLSCANESCQRGEHFHNRCVRSILPVQHDDNWYCSAECAGDGERDEFLDYIHRITWCSLFSECIRDAEREGDGIASMAYWRISMPELFARGHDQHVAATHRLLAGTSGCFPPRIREEVIHNRTMNLHGGKGKNISLDFSTEQLDNAKEAPSKTQGEKNSKSKKTAGNSLKRFARYHNDVDKFVDNFGDIFCEMKGRIIPSLCGKIVGQEITQEKASAMKKCLLKLNKKFDKEMMK